MGEGVSDTVGVVRGGCDCGGGGETDTELVEAVVSDGVGRDCCWVHTSDTGATMAGTWVEDIIVVVVAAMGAAAGTGGTGAFDVGVVGVVTVVASLLICDWEVNTHTHILKEAAKTSAAVIFRIYYKRMDYGGGHIATHYIFGMHIG